MTIAQLDPETRKIIYLAHILVKFPKRKDVLPKLRAALDDWDREHEAERAKNLIDALWPKETPTECLCKFDAMCCPVHDPSGARD